MISWDLLSGLFLLFKNILIHRILDLEKVLYTILSNFLLNEEIQMSVIPSDIYLASSKKLQDRKVHQPPC